MMEGEERITEECTEDEEQITDECIDNFDDSKNQPKSMQVWLP